MPTRTCGTKRRKTRRDTKKRVSILVRCVSGENLKGRFFYRYKSGTVIAEKHVEFPDVSKNCREAQHDCKQDFDAVSVFCNI